MEPIVSVPSDYLIQTQNQLSESKAVRKETRKFFQRKVLFNNNCINLIVSFRPTSLLDPLSSQIFRVA